MLHSPPPLRLALRSEKSWPRDETVTRDRRFQGRFLAATGTFPREHLSSVIDKLAPLNTILGSDDADKLLDSALPRLANFEYYGTSEKTFLVPIRFGMNGLAFNSHARDWMRSTSEAFTWPKESVTATIDLPKLMVSVSESNGQIQAYRWGFRTPVELMLRRAHRVQQPEPVNESETVGIRV